MSRSYLVLITMGVSSIVVGSCDTYEPAPQVSIDGLVDGTLPDRTAALAVRFSKPVDPASLRAEVAVEAVNSQGLLADEDDDPLTQLDLLYGHDPTHGDLNGTSEWAESNALFRIQPSSPWPLGLRLVLLVEPGLRDLQDNETAVRRRVSFSFPVSCAPDPAPLTSMPSGVYVIVNDLVRPAPYQFLLFADIRANDPLPGRLRMQVTRAARDRSARPCPSDPCPTAEACRSLPQPVCVSPSDPVGSEDEFVDFLPDTGGDTGYTTAVDGCAHDEGGAILFVTSPSDSRTKVPDIASLGAVMSGQLAMSDGVLRGSGSITVAEVDFQDSVSGTTSAYKDNYGRLRIRQIPAAQVPADLPRVP